MLSSIYPDSPRAKLREQLKSGIFMVENVHLEKTSPVDGRENISLSLIRSALCVDEQALTHILEKK